MIYEAYSKSIETETVFTNIEMNNEWNTNFFGNSQLEVNLDLMTLVTEQGVNLGLAQGLTCYKTESSVKTVTGVKFK